MTDQAENAVKKTAEEAGEAKKAADDATEQVTNGVGDATGTLRQQVVASFADAAKSVLVPAIQQMSQQAAEQATTYAKEQGPRIVKEQVLPQVLKATGADNPGDMIKQGIGKVGEGISDSGGISGIAGKLMSKYGGGGKQGGKKATATGYGQGRRIMVQQIQYVPVNVKDVYRAWTESEWPEYMHRVNTLDRQIDEEDARYAIGIKGFWFKKNFTAQVQEQVPYKYIVWSTTQGNIKNTGRVSFIEQGEDLTLMILNLDMAPAGLKEKWVRGFRYHKRGIRSDFHRFAAWLQMRTPDQLLDMDGWLGTIEGGKITQTHEEYVEEHEEEQERAQLAEEQGEDVMEDRYMPEDDKEDDNNGEEQDGEDEAGAGEEDEDGEGASRSRGRGDEGGEEGEEGGEEDGEEDQAVEEDDSTDDEDEEVEDEDDEEPEEEPEPKPKARQRAARPARRKRQTAK